MALTNAERQARHRNRVKEKLASIESGVDRKPKELVAAQSHGDGWEVVNRWRLKFQEGMVELLEQNLGEYDHVPAVHEPQQMAIQRFNQMGAEGQIRLLYAELRLAGHAAAAKISDACQKEWGNAHPEPKRPSTYFNGVRVEVTSKRRRRVT